MHIIISHVWLVDDKLIDLEGYIGFGNNKVKHINPAKSSRLFSVWCYLVHNLLEILHTHTHIL